MTAIVPTDGSGGSAVRALKARRCVRHETREAAVRCPQCGQFFCRECVVEHENRLVCTTCLGGLVAGAARKPDARRSWRPAVDVLGVIVAFLVAIFCFDLLGSLLLKIPASFHEGTIWRQTRGGDSK